MKIEDIFFWIVVIVLGPFIVGIGGIALIAVVVLMFLFLLSGPILMFYSVVVGGFYGILLFIFGFGLFIIVLFLASEPAY